MSSDNTNLNTAMAQIYTQNQDLTKEAFGITYPNQFYQFLISGNFRVSDSLESFCLRNYGRSLDTQILIMNEDLRLNKRQISKQRKKNFKFYILNVNNINPLKSSITIQPIENKRLIILNILFKRSDNLYVSDPLMNMSYNPQTKETTINYSNQNINSLEMKYILIDDEIEDEINITGLENIITIKKYKSIFTKVGSSSYRMSIKPESLDNQSSSNLQEVSEDSIIREVKPNKVEFVKPLRIITEMQD